MKDYEPPVDLKLARVTDPRVVRWLRQRAADENVTMHQLVRRAIDREIVANPTTLDPMVTAGIVGYLLETYGLSIATTASTTIEELRDEHEEPTPEAHQVPGRWRGSRRPGPQPHG